MSDTTFNQNQYEALINNCEPVDANDPAYEKIFRDLQGGVIKNYGRDYSIYIFVQFDRDKKEDIKKWIRDEIAGNITSTWRQLENTKIFKRIKEQDLDFPGKLCKNFFLSHQGYKSLGFNSDNGEEKINDSKFTRGMKNNWIDSYRIDPPPEDYWYNPPESWDIGNDRIDALILLAHDNLEELKNEAATIFEIEFNKIGKVVSCEAGYVLRDKKKNKTVGPFGFADNISQPLFLKDDYDKYCESQNHKIDLWDPKASLNLVLVKDPFTDAEYSYGSYCVFQKLETNSKCFEKKVDGLAEQLKCDSERASALVFGRFKDGTPIALSDKPSQTDGNSNIENNFNFADDSYGGKCPLHAHIRKVNPRKDLDDPAQEKDRRTINRIFRAGVTYFDAPTGQQVSNILQLCLNKLGYLGHINEVNKGSLADKAISGLLFVCFQKSISQQFSLLQQQWADNARFPRLQGEAKHLDPIIGHPLNHNRQQQYPSQQEWSKKWNVDQVASYAFHGCVKERGGEFFFAPSISFLKNL